ncbi:MAG: hypothetical protein J6X55_09625 [Victivallales bacterium]|nr:hypothetical protein [Victivallales bacterium]
MQTITSRKLYSKLNSFMETMRFIEEWGSGLRRVNKVFADYGLQNISLEDAGFAVKMNVYRVTKTGGEGVKTDSISKKTEG